ncbi:MAG: leucyl/phenylalanyl-tRNA--protein transferase [Leptospiraceae bacterium]|nr:leucyl/phenylalanyl-tRNA--protein transferase [Leptospiraceae bacterium]MCK6381013.1 leucyl/phenylalanyl-tRNA--protein transferase [Leptospiraceae bacterium]NUM41411.1 leucyl/phenylalanyl-tRNA--protein transferase [Leptospiraceae bacterium]
MSSRDFKEFFGDPLNCDEDLIAIGGDFSVDRLLYAYTHGIFPWSENPIQWFCLDPRAVFDIQNVHFSKTVLRKIRQNKYCITYNLAFTRVMENCAIRKNEPTWITSGFVKGYSELHLKGYAHSVEAWDEEENLVGGVYGIAIGKLFAGESMFSFQPDAGKVALYYLFEALKKDQFCLFDTQQLNEVTWNLGAFEITKNEYLNALKEAVKIPYKWELK